MPIWNPRAESMSRTDLAQLQLERLQITLNRAYRSVAHYHSIMEAQRFLPERVESLEQLAQKGLKE